MPKVKKTDKLAKVMAALQPVEKSYTTDNGKDQKTTEFYMDVLARHQQELGKQRLTVWMQVGSFFEVYGFKWQDGRTLGNVWEVAADLDIKIARKSMLVMNDPTVEVYMAGVKEEYADPYLERLVDQHGWTVAIYVQEKMSAGTNEFKRVLKTITSPGINFDTDNISNVLMYIYFKACPSRMNGGVSLNCGVYYVDCINGNNGVQELNTPNIQDPSVLFSELIKIITIRNPAEVIIHCDLGIEKQQQQLVKYQLFTELELNNNLGLGNRTVKYIWTPPIDKYSNKSFQVVLLSKAFSNYQTRGCILDELDLGGQYEFGRLALCLALEYIYQHDTSILTLLERPEIHRNSSQYLMLANNCLQQLDIIDPTANARVSYMSRDSELLGESQLSNSRRKVSLLDLLDKTKTVIGRRLFRQRLSTPITDINELDSRYIAVENLINTQREYLSKPGAEKVNTPYSRLRYCLGQIKDIPKYMRKIATLKMTPADLDMFTNSLREAVNLINIAGNDDLALQLPETLQEYLKTEYHNDIKLWKKDLTKIIKKGLDGVFNYPVCDNHWANINDNIFNKGFSSKADELYNAVCLDRQFFNDLKSGLSKLIADNLPGASNTNNKITGAVNITQSDKNQFIREETNTRLGQYLSVNEKYKSILESLNPETTINIGNYVIKLSDITYYFLKQKSWQIRTEYLHLSSKNLSDNLEQLKKTLRIEFDKWQTQFYADNYKSLGYLTTFVGEVDVIQSSAFIATQYGYVKPNITPNANLNDNSNDHQNINKSYLKVRGIRHPIVEQIHSKSRYITNDLEFGVPEQDGILLFGVNASGKSTTMKAVGCCIIMAQAGMWVPASEFTYYPYSYLFTRIRNNDDIHAGLSSFEVEMREFRVILQHSNENSMILGDELCSGTETLDATAIVASGLKLLAKRRANFIFATHLHFLSEIPEVCELPNLKFYHLSVEMDPENPNVLVYDRRLRPGNGPQSYGITVCRSMNLDMEFVRDAERIRLGIERGDILGRFSGRLCKENKTELLPARVSKYNVDKIVDICEVCGASNIQIDVHHIDNQCNADSLGIITNINTQERYHKNMEWNLVNLCKECHLRAHGKSASGNLLIIDGYKSTSQGNKLNWHLEKLKSDVLDVPPPPYSPMPNVNDIMPNVNDIIINYYKQGKTYKSIQYTLRNTHNIKYKIQDINKVIQSFNH